LIWEPIYRSAAMSVTAGTYDKSPNDKAFAGISGALKETIGDEVATIEEVFSKGYETSRLEPV
jgi:hypothetical protein